ncbi:MAG: S8 family peptidase [Halieaceae bacterium]|jgi:serine protease|nr:S8 family peptidase [Halieaceae bacterium]
MQGIWHLMQTPIRLRWLATALACGLLAGCINLQLGGSVTEASVTIAALDSPDDIVQSLQTPSVAEVREDDGPERWDARDDLGQLVLLGNLTVDRSLYEDERFYLVTARGGLDQDADTDNRIDENPATNFGRWHAILRGADMGRGKVSPLTDAIYRVLEPALEDLSPAQLLQELDSLAQGMVEDTNNSGGVDYVDVLGWHRHLNAEQYRLDIERVNELSRAIRASASASTLRELSFAVVGREPPADGGISYTLSGTINVPPTSRVDSDVNNDFAPLVSNSSFALSQPLTAPVVTGGHVNLPFSGAPGATRQAGDTQDFYRTTLQAGDRITLVIAEDVDANDLDLYLYDAGQELVDASLGTTQFEQLLVPEDGDYFVEVRVFDDSSNGASNYLLTLGIDSLPANTPLRRLSDDFRPGDVLASFRHSRDSDSPAGRERISGMRYRGGGRRGANLLQLRDRLDNLPLKQRKLRTLRAMKRLARNPEVEQVGLNYHVYASAVPNDPNYGLQAWHYEQIDLPAAWDLSKGEDTVVAVIDTGVRRNHPDLAGKLVPGYDFFDDDPNPEDPGDSESDDEQSSFHGTHVAGTVGAATNNRLGVAGVGWNTRIMPLRVLGPGGGTTFDVLRAVRFAAGLTDSFDDSVPTPQRTADVINLSLAGGGFDSFAQQLYNEVAALGIIVVAAAGNDGNAELAYPASYDNVISVTATDINSNRAFYANFGTAIDVAAPGGSNRTNDVDNNNQPDTVLSTGADDFPPPVTDTYVFLQGTSMAAPHVAGVAALMKSLHPALDTDTFEALLAQSLITDDLGAPGRDNSFGWGLINARRAVEAAQALAAGEPLALLPNLTTSASTLNFGAFANRLPLTVGNSGPGTLIIESISGDQPWLSVAPAAVDANGVGRYNVLVDRDQLLEQRTFTGEISIRSNDGGATRTVPVIVANPDPTVFTEGNAGPHYVLLIDSASGEVVQEQAVVASQGRYEYRFSDVPAGSYEIVGGSDADNDFFICDPGESCGAWPALADELPSIDVVEDINGLDFSSSYDTGVVSIGATQATASSRLPARRRSAYVRPDSAGEARSVQPEIRDHGSGRPR